MAKNKELSAEQRSNLLKTLEGRFEKNMNRHKGLVWTKVEAKLKANTDKLWSISEMKK